MKHADIIARLTLEEKCKLLQGKTTFGSWPLPDKGIPALEFSDGPNGVRHQAGEADHLGLNGSMPATCFPTAVTVANTWDEELGERIGAAMAEEAATQGVHVLLGPGLCIKRNPLCGRNFEYFSEDPYLAGKMAAAYVRGIQSEGVGACPKHFAVNSQETRRQASDSVVDERTLREIYLTGFEIVARESAPKGIMSSYNLINGVYANENEHLLGEILRDEWGFDGAVVTDWGGSNDHATGVAAGSTFEMPAPGLASVRELVAAVREGRISESDIDERADEAIELVLSTRKAVEDAASSFDVDAHHALARQAAAEGCVLLKNDAPAEGASPLLPLPAATKVALIGDFAKTPRYQGAGSSAVNSTKVDSLLDTIDGSGLALVGYEPGFERHGGKNDSKRDAALDLAGKADVVILALALDVVTGKACPSGKLTETWPVRWEDVPSSASYPSDEKQAQYREGIYVGYRYFDTAGREVAFPFGYGLSYTTFAYSDMKATAEGATFTVTNTGSVAGTEVAQLYVSKPGSQVFRAEQELKGFARVELAPGESKDVTIALDDKAFRYFNTRTNAWEVEPGSYELRVGASSRDIRLTATVEVEGTDAPNPYEGRDVSAYESADVLCVSDASFEALLGHAVPDEGPAISRNMCFRDLNHGRSPIFWLVWAILRAMKTNADKSGHPNLNVLFIWNMPRLLDHRHPPLYLRVRRQPRPERQVQVATRKETDHEL